jgi:hypothetical protein
MGFLASAAARSEMRLRDTVLSSLQEVRPDFQTGPLLLPCHIVGEVHNGFFISTGSIVVGVFRCQLHWWGHEIDAETLSGLRSPDSSSWLRRLVATRPMDLGNFRGGIPEIVAGLAFGLTAPSAGGAEGPLSDHQSFGDLVEAANDYLTKADIPVMMRYGAEATSALPAERTLVEADGLEDFVLLERDQTWHVADDTPLAEQVDTGLQVAGPQYLAMAVATQIVFSWSGAIDRGSTELYDQFEIRERFIRPIARFLLAISSVAEQQGDQELADRADQVLLLTYPLLRTDL